LLDVAVFPSAVVTVLVFEASFSSFERVVVTVPPLGVVTVLLCCARPGVAANSNPSKAGLNVLMLMRFLLATFVGPCPHTKNLTQ
jgi:hypothetical protein